VRELARRAATADSFLTLPFGRIATTLENRGAVLSGN